MMDAERLLELFQTKPSIIDDKDAKPLKFIKGEVIFKNVSFTYDGRRTSLKGVDFVIAGGSTVGIVGETGGGKSTILRLLDRFYDVTDGSIEIDGQDIRKITLKRYVFYTMSKLLVAV
jgi:ABC-type multidrug transport system fused ATPase/permease subunit